MSTNITKIVGTEIQYFPSEIKKERKMVVVERELERLYNQHQRVTVDDVLADAISDESPLHSYFEWNDAAAAERYRKVQAYSLIMSSKFVVQLVEDSKVEPKTISESGQVRKLVSAFRGEGFRLRNEALADTDMRTAIIEAKKTALRSWCKSSIDIAELQPLRELILSHL